MILQIPKKPHKRRERIDNFFNNCPRSMNEYRPKQIKRTKRKAGLTRRDLADKIGCREHTIIRWENGENKKPLSPYRKELEKFYSEMLMK